MTVTLMNVPTKLYKMIYGEKRETPASAVQLLDTRQAADIKARQTICNR